MSERESMPERVEVLERAVFGDDMTHSPGLLRLHEETLQTLTDLKKLGESHTRALERLSLSVMGDESLQTPSIRQHMKNIDNRLRKLELERNRIVWLARIIAGLGAGNAYLIVRELITTIN